MSDVNYEQFTTKRDAYIAGRDDALAQAQDGKLTMAQIKQMSTDEINARWDEVQAALKGANA